MTKPQDIIGLVKEEQGSKCTCCSCCREYCDHCLFYQYNGEKIAEALIIAIEALEASADEQIEENRGHLKVARPSRTAIRARKILARIRSLPLS